VLWRRPTGSRLCGGPAITTMQPVNGGVGFPGMAVTGGAPDITATEGDDGGSGVLFDADDRRPPGSGLNNLRPPRRGGLFLRAEWPGVRGMG
jgi:hypothetical protein